MRYKEYRILAVSTTLDGITELAKQCLNTDVDITPISRMGSFIVRKGFRLTNRWSIQYGAGILDGLFIEWTGRRYLLLIR